MDHNKVAYLGYTVEVLYTFADFETLKYCSKTE